MSVLKRFSNHFFNSTGLAKISEHRRNEAYPFQLSLLQMALNSSSRSIATQPSSLQDYCALLNPCPRDSKRPDAQSFSYLHILCCYWQFRLFHYHCKILPSTTRRCSRWTKSELRFAIWVKLHSDFGFVKFFTTIFMKIFMKIVVITITRRKYECSFKSTYILWDLNQLRAVTFFCDNVLIFFSTFKAFLSTSYLAKSSYKHLQTCSQIWLCCGFVRVLGFIVGRSAVCVHKQRCQMYEHLLVNVILGFIVGRSAVCVHKQRCQMYEHLLVNVILAQSICIRPYLWTIHYFWKSGKKVRFLWSLNC